jgi:hypothetical protein
MPRTLRARASQLTHHPSNLRLKYHNGTVVDRKDFKRHPSVKEHVKIVEQWDMRGNNVRKDPEGSVLNSRVKR